MKCIFLVLMTGCLSAGIAVAGPGEALKELPVQDGGRVKPFNTFARETLQLIYGKEKFRVPKQKEEDPVTYRGANEVVFTWLLVPEHWRNIPLIQVRNGGLKEALGLDAEQVKEKTHFSPEELMNNDRLALLIQELNNKRKAQEKLDPYFQAVQTLESQLTTFQAIRMGQGLRVLPPPPDQETTTWLSVSELPEEAAQKFSEITQSFAENVGLEMNSQARTEQKIEAFAKLKSAVSAFKEMARQRNPQAYEDDLKIRMEVHLKDFHPFQWAWIFYLLATFLAAAALSNQKKIYRQFTWIMLILGLVFHTYGMALRVYIVGRPPVSNMYETIIWVPWVGVIFALIFEKIRSTNMLFLSAGLVGTLCLILSDLSPVVLDPSLQPLQPVLRDNFWLIVHVLVIVTSYAAFFLAFILGDLCLFYFLRGEEKFKKSIKDGVQGIYRAMQIGVVLLALGIILGGVWADYSWGRFWGWDPKETWALIALLGYVAVLHARLTGWVRDFGMSVVSVLAFSLVIMAWYGFYFVLGAGLHTYGFGAGGVEYVAGFVALHILYVVYVATVRQSRLKPENP